MTKELVEESLEITCSNCRKMINKVWVCKLEIPDVTRYVFFCPNCQRCLGVSDNKNPNSLLQQKNNLPPASINTNPS
ncbi:MAG TPA: hypothetical protein VLB50_13470 [Ignavibacteriaceae bacterium]|nr:hypothetical protein [Ignavibacteriaceae bacterium]